MCEACSGKGVILIQSDEIRASARFDGISIEIVDHDGDVMIWDVAYCPFCGRKLDGTSPTITNQKENDHE